MVVRIKIGFTALLVAAFAAGCGSMEASTEKSAASKATGKSEALKTVKEADGVDVETGYITGSRIPRKATQNTQGVTQTNPDDWRRYNQPAAPLKSN